MKVPIDLHIYIHSESEHEINVKLERISKQMATVAEILTAIDGTTNNIAGKIGELGDDTTAIKDLVQKLKDGQTDPTLVAQAQAALDKLTVVSDGLNAVEQQLEDIGKAEPPVTPTP